MNAIQPTFMIVEEICHYRNGKCIWKKENIPNIWHVEGQQYLLSVAFDTDGGISIPTNYFLGLDNRTTLAAADTLLDLVNEPATNGYSRQSLSSATGFVVAVNGGTGNMTATSGIATFSATAGSWGPVSQVFLATTVNNAGLLISSAPLGSSQTVVGGDAITIRINLSLAGCP